MKCLGADISGKVQFTVVTIILSGLLSSCVKGKDCEQLYHDITSFENRTSRNLTLEFVSYGDQSFTLEMKPLEKADEKVIKVYYQTHEGGFQKGGAPSNGQCEPEPVRMGVSGFLSEKSFGTVKHCWDNDAYKSIILETSDSCPSGTWEQKSAGFPKSSATP